MTNLDSRIDRPGAVVAFADSGGSGRPIVLTHGAGLDHTMFDAQAAALVDRGFRVILWDMRGHGRSRLMDEARFSAADALDDLRALLEECEVEAPVLIGHSLGGNLVQAFTRTSPDSAGGVIVLDSAWNTGPLSTIERLSLRAAAPVLSLIPARRLPRLMARASAVTEEGIDRAEETFARIPKPVFLDVWRAAASFVAPDPDYRSPVPLALIRGESDRTGNIAAAMSDWAAHEGIGECVIPGAGHIVTWDAPDQTSRLLLEVLDGWAGESDARSGRP